MSMRRVTILEGMFLDIASQGDRLKVDELYRNGNKGSAVVYMLKRVREKWVELINRPSSIAVKKKVLDNTNNEVFFKRIQLI